jgi:hypothetical protein
MNATGALQTNTGPSLTTSFMPFFEHVKPTAGLSNILERAMINYKSFFKLRYMAIDTFAG